MGGPAKVTRLGVIDAVARHGSVTAAAKELHYSQPSVTNHLARLEAETGAQLVQARRPGDPADITAPLTGAQKSPDCSRALAVDETYPRPSVGAAALKGSPKDA